MRVSWPLQQRTSRQASTTSSRRSYILLEILGKGMECGGTTNSVITQLWVVDALAGCTAVSTTQGIACRHVSRQSSDCSVDCDACGCPLLQYCS